MAEGAVHGVELHAVFEILIGGRERVGDVRGVALHGGVDGAHGEVAFDVRRLDVGGCRQEAEHGEAESAEDEDDERDDYAESELSHGASGGIVADGRGGALVFGFRHY